MHWKAHGWAVCSFLGFLASILTVLPPLSLRAAPLPNWTGRARDQVQAVQAEKAGRTAAQRKINSQLLFALRQARGEDIAKGAPLLRPLMRVEPDGRVLVDMRAMINADLLNRIERGGGRVIKSFPQSQSLRALVPLALLESLSARPEVRNIRPADEFTTQTFVTEGDLTHQADIARADLGIDGSGVKIGALSDSVDFLSA
jgi:hypothetical protein